jgi:hypothetical protein
MNKNKFFIALLFVSFLSTEITVGAPCTYTQSGNLSSNITFASIINCDNGDVTLSSMSSHPSGSGKVTFASNVTLNSMDIGFASGNKPIEFIIPAGVTVTIIGNLTFSGQADKDKFFTIDGVLIVGGTLDLGDLQFEIDGTGSIDAGSIIGADDTTCSTGSGGTGTCPTITTESCDDGGGDFCTDPGVTLPIELAFFDALASGQSIKVNWSTFSEINNDYFTIERSSDGLNYQSIATVAGAGNSSEELEYSYVDRNPLFGRSYYRLKQTDFDGASETFAPVAVDFTSLSNGDITFTNPVRYGEEVTVYANTDETENLKLTIFNMVGEKIIDQNFSGVSYSFQLDADVRPGIYFVRISSVNSEKTGRLLIQ